VMLLSCPVADIAAARETNRTAMVRVNAVMQFIFPFSCALELFAMIALLGR